MCGGGNSDGLPLKNHRAAGDADLGWKRTQDYQAGRVDSYHLSLAQQQHISSERIIGTALGCETRMKMGMAR